MSMPQPSSVLQARLYARRLREAANEFRDFPNDGHVTLSREGKDAAGHPCKIITGVRSATQLQEVCGIWLIEAHKLHLIPADEVRLLRLIEEHANPYPKNEPLPAGTLMRRDRCPYNLFLDIRAGGIPVGRLVERSGRVELEATGEPVYGRAWNNPSRFAACIDGKPVEVFADRRQKFRETGGLMENVAPGAVQRRPMERNAETCEWLADLIESIVNKPGRKRSSNREAVAMRVKELNDQEMAWKDVMARINEEFPRQHDPWRITQLRGMVRNRKR